MHPDNSEEEERLKYVSLKMKRRFSTSVISAGAFLGAWLVPGGNAVQASAAPMIPTSCIQAPTNGSASQATPNAQTSSLHPRPVSTTGEAMFPSARLTADENAGMMPGHNIEVNSSIQVSREVLRDAYQASRDAYTQKLQKYAKLSPANAEKAVKAAHPGMKVEGLQLRNIRTSLVYVSVVSDDQDKYLVIVDAGNGKVLMDRRLETHHERVFASH